VPGALDGTEIVENVLNIVFDCRFLRLPVACSLPYRTATFKHGLVVFLDEIAYVLAYIHAIPHTRGDS